MSIVSNPGTDIGYTGWGFC